MHSLKEKFEKNIKKKLLIALVLIIYKCTIDFDCVNAKTNSMKLISIYPLDFQRIHAKRVEIL